MDFQNNFSDASQVLEYICRQFGRTSLQNEAKCLGYFSDLAPKLKNERHLLQMFFKCGGARIADPQEQASLDRIANQIISRMQDEYFLTEEASVSICQKYAQALGVQINILSVPNPPHDTETQRRIAEQQRIAEEQRLLAQQQKLAEEQRRLALQQKQAEEQRLLAMQQKQAEEQRRLALQQKQAEEQQRIARQEKSEEKKDNFLCTLGLVFIIVSAIVSYWLSGRITDYLYPIVQPYFLPQLLSFARKPGLPKLVATIAGNFPEVLIRLVCFLFLYWILWKFTELVFGWLWD